MIIIVQSLAAFERIKLHKKFFVSLEGKLYRRVVIERCLL